MARTEEIAGISIGIGANTSALDAALSAVETRVNNLKNIEVVVSAKVAGTSQLNTAIKEARSKLADLAKTPVPIRFNFAITKQVATQLNNQMSKAITQIGGLKVMVIGDPQDLIKSLAGTVIPVTVRGEWEGGGGPVSGGGGRRPPRGPSGGGGAPAAGAAQPEAKAAQPITPARRGTGGRFVATVVGAAVPTGTTIPANEEAGRRVQAQAGLNRGIYPSGTPIGALRRQIEEGMGISPSIGISPDNPLYKRYVAAGGDPESLKIGIARPLAGREASYAAEFAKEAIGRRSAPSQLAKASGRHPMDVRQSGIHRGALPLTPAQYEKEMSESFNKDVDREFSKLEIKGHFAKTFSATGEPLPDRPVYEGKRGALIEGIRQELFEGMLEPDLDKKIEKISEAVKGLFSVGASQRRSLETLATARGKPGKGKSRFNKLIGQKGRSPTNISDYEIIDVRNMALAGSTELSRLLEIQRGEPGEDAGTLGSAIEQATAKFKATVRKKQPKLPRVVLSDEEKAKAEADVKADRATREAAEKAAFGTATARGSAGIAEGDLAALADARIAARRHASSPAAKTALADEMRKRDEASRAHEAAGQRGSGMTKAEWEASQGMKPYGTLLSGLAKPGPLEFTSAARGGQAESDLAALQLKLADEARARSARGRHAAMARWHPAAVGAPVAAGVAAEPGKMDPGAITPILMAGGPNAEKLAAQLRGQGIPIPPLGKATEKSIKRAFMLGAGGGGGGGGGSKGAGGDEDVPKKQFVTSAKVRQTLGEAAIEDLRQKARTDVEKYFTQSRELKQQSRAILEENPVRALSVAFGQVLVNLTGRAGLKKRVQIAQDEATKADRFVRSYERAHFEQGKAETYLAEIRKSGNAEEITAAEENVKQTRAVSYSRAREAVEQRRIARGARAGVAGSKLEQARITAQTLAVGTVGIVAGTEVFTLAMTAVNLGLQQLGIGLGRAFDRLTGYEEVTGKVTSAIADQIRATNGQAKAATSATLAQAGFGDQTAASIEPIIQQRATVVAGTKAFQDQLDLMNTARNGRNPLVQTTGGFPIGQIGGDRSIRELLTTELGAMTSTGAQRAAGVPTQMENAPSAGYLSPIVDFFMGSPFKIDAKQLAADTKKLKENTAWWNENAQRGGSSFHLAAGNAKEIAAQTDKLASAHFEGAAELGATLAKQGLVLRDTTGKLLTSENDFIDFFQGIAVGGTIPSKSLLLAAARPQLQAGLAGRVVQGQFERQTTLPAQQFLSQLARPLIPFGQTVAARTPGATDASNYKAAALSIDQAQTSLRAYADQGQRAALETIRTADAVTGTNLEGAWKTATSAVADYGKRIASLQIDMTWKQVNLQVHQYDEQLRVANRSLADAKEFLTGIKQSGSDGLGILERQTRELSKQSTLIGFQQTALQLQLSQRQINFQVAMAGFVAPGTTPQERAARVDEAKKEAEFAQQQLDLQKQQFEIAKALFGIQQGPGGIIDVNAVRQVEDLNHQLSLLKEGRKVTIELAIDSENLAAMQQGLDAEMARAQSVLTQAVDIKNQIIAVGVSIEASTAQDIISAVRGALAVLGAAGAGFTNLFNGYGNGTVPAGGRYGGKPVPLNAAGMLANVSGTTHMIVGEAGNETVAVLRNPRSMTMAGSGNGGSVINITVTGNTVRNDDDINKIALAVQRKVEETMGRKASQFGLRGAR